MEPADCEDNGEALRAGDIKVVYDDGCFKYIDRENIAKYVQDIRLNLSAP